MDKQRHPRFAAAPPYDEAEKLAFERAFQVTFLEEEAMAGHAGLNFRTRVIPRNVSYGLPTDLAGQSVAVVGNGIIRSGGAEIDAHDQVIRISAMPNRTRDAATDGSRTTLWAGHPVFVINRDRLGQRTANLAFETLARDGVPLWAISPFHITCDSYLWLEEEERLSSLLISPSPNALSERLRYFLPSEEMSEIFSLAVDRGHLGELTNFELLTTGTRIIVLLEACNVKAISLYGFDLFKTSPDSVWFGHDLSLDLRVINNVQNRFIKAGKIFNWRKM